MTNYDSPDLKELVRRRPIAFSQFQSLLERIHDIHKANEEELPKEISAVEKKKFVKALFESVLIDEQPELKRSIARRMANKIGNYFLWRREPTIPVIHELLVLLPWWLGNIPNEVIPKIRDIGLSYILNGMVVPIQTVWKDILSSPFVYLGHCTCRSSKIVEDLYVKENIHTFTGKEENIILLDRIMDKYKELVQRHGKLPNTDPRFERVFQQLSFFRQSKSDKYCMETFLELTYPDWEILPVLDKYTPTWIRSLHKNHKAHRMDKELCFELANILYLAKGIIFSSMKLIDTPYTICSCPTPESGGGCVLTNWYYFGMSNSSVLPNESAHGRLKDGKGNVLPCQYFPQRSTRGCLGCGCKHDMTDPRSVESILNQADNILRNYL